MAISRDSGSHAIANGYQVVKVNENRPVLDSEFNEIQEIILNSQQVATEVQNGTGPAISGLSVTYHPASSPPLFDISAGNFYIDGRVFAIGAVASMHANGDVFPFDLYVELLKREVDHTIDSYLEDPTLLTPTAEREQWIVTLYNHDTTGALPDGSYISRTVTHIYHVASAGEAGVTAWPPAPLTNVLLTPTDISYLRGFQQSSIAQRMTSYHSFIRLRQNGYGGYWPTPTSSPPLSPTTFFAADPSFPVSTEAYPGQKFNNIPYRGAAPYREWPTLGGGIHFGEVDNNNSGPDYSVAFVTKVRVPNSASLYHNIVIPVFAADDGIYCYYTEDTNPPAMPYVYDAHTGGLGDGTSFTWTNADVLSLSSSSPNSGRIYSGLPHGNDGFVLQLQSGLVYLVCLIFYGGFDQPNYFMLGDWYDLTASGSTQTYEAYPFIDWSPQQVLPGFTQRQLVMPLPGSGWLSGSNPNV